MSIIKVPGCPGRIVSDDFLVNYNYRVYSISDGPVDPDYGISNFPSKHAGCFNFNPLNYELVSRRVGRLKVCS